MNSGKDMQKEKAELEMKQGFSCLWFLKVWGSPDEKLFLSSSPEHLHVIQMENLSHFSEFVLRSSHFLTNLFWAAAENRILLPRVLQYITPC